MKIVKRNELLQYISTCILNATVGYVQPTERNIIIYVDTNAKIALNNTLLSSMSPSDYTFVNENEPKTSNAFFIANGIKCGIKSCDMSDNRDLLIITVNEVMIARLKYKNETWYILNYRNEYCETI